MDISNLIQSLIVFVYGLFIGSFLNVLIDRLPQEEQVLKGRSHCDHCHRNLTWIELIPVLSFIFQKGRSRCCHKKLSFQYPLVELATGIGFAIIYYFTLDYSIIPLFNYWIIIISYLILFSSFLVIFVTDVKTQIIPDSMLVTSLIGIALVNVLSNDSLIINLKSLFLNNFLSALGAFLFFLIIYLVTRGKGMGFGDVKLVFVLGLFLGFPRIIFALYSAFLTGAIIGVILVLIHKKSMKSQVPFGPFLIIGCLISFIFESQFIIFWKGVL